MDANKSIILDIEERIATITFNRPHVYNAMDEEMFTAFLGAIRQVAESDTSILILKGEGKGFSAGGDIQSMLSGIKEEGFSKVMDTITELITTLYTLPKLVISAVHGSAVGFGLSVALAADHIMSTESARLGINFIKIGLIPDGGAHFFLQQRLGEVKAKRMIWHGEMMKAQQALELGLVDELVAVDDIYQAALQKAEQWLKMPIQAMVETKRIYTESRKKQLVNILLMEKTGQSKVRRTADHAEGIQAFLEKRLPQFKGD